ncbi:MAG: DNA primase [Thermodesulfobacteriota bacterium]|nr:DNA primase [Thermodesulfobacteriota bacterium]
MANGFLSEEKISEIRDRASILEVVSDHVSLKKTGRNHKGLCPFHSEKTPSFMVNEEKQIFHCFGCGEGGDVFAFLMKTGHFSFPEAAEELAKRYGIKLLRRESSPLQKKEMAKREVLFRINQLASDYFHDLLTQKGEGEAGRKYLSQRSVSEQIIKEHRLGYSPERWDGLVQHLIEKKVPLELAWELGLILPKKKEGWYDAFRKRIIFPIFDLHQRVVGFGGRLIGEGQPKYINSSESSLYHKGEVLYGLQAARRYASERDGVIIVEGYFDLLTLHQYGLKHSVAMLGTALTAQQIRTLRRYTKNVITVFDPDPAGIQATLRTLPLLLEEEVTGKTILLPKGEDPDTFLKKGNLEGFEKRLAEAIPLIDFFFEWLMKTHDPKSIDGKVSIAKEGMAMIRRIPEKIRKDFYVRALAERLDLKESVLYEMIQSTPPERTRPAEGLKKRPPEESLPKSEEIVVRLMIHHPELIPTISGERILDEFESPLLKRLGQGLEGIFQKKGKLDLTEALEGFNEGLKERLCEFAFQESGVEGDQRERILKDCIEKIRRRKSRKDESDLLRRIKEAERQKEGGGLDALLMERQEMAKREKGRLKGSLPKA